MPYPDLPPSATFWRCPKCGNEDLFFAQGSGAITCGKCSQVSTQDQLLAEHARAHPDQPAAAH